MPLIQNKELSGPLPKQRHYSAQFWASFSLCHFINPSKAVRLILAFCKLSWFWAIISIFFSKEESNLGHKWWLQGFSTWRFSPIYFLQFIVKCVAVSPRRESCELSMGSWNKWILHAVFGTPLIVAHIANRVLTGNYITVDT